MMLLMVQEPMALQVLQEVLIPMLVQVAKGLHRKKLISYLRKKMMLGLMTAPQEEI
jgi:hypothetical protein